MSTDSFKNDRNKFRPFEVYQGDPFPEELIIPRELIDQPIKPDICKW